MGTAIKLGSVVGINYEAIKKLAGRTTARETILCGPRAPTEL